MSDGFAWGAQAALGAVCAGLSLCALVVGAYLAFAAWDIFFSARARDEARYLRESEERARRERAP